MRTQYNLRALVLVIGLLAVPGVSPVQAEISQCGSRGPYLDGFYRFPQESYEGVHARITAQWGWVCNTDTNPLSNFTNSWSMVVDRFGHNGWAQSGFERGYGTGIRHFAQQMRSQGDFFTQYGSYFPEGENHGYWQQYDPSCSCIHSNVDQTRLMTSWFDPKFWWPQPFGVQFLGEAAYRESDIPGYGGTRTNFSGLEVQRSSDHAYITIPCFLYNINDNPSRWSVWGNSCTNFDIWTHSP